MLFRCDQCGCVDLIEYAAPDALRQPPGHWLCSACCPVVLDDGTLQPGTWHNQFPKRLYNPQEDIVVNVNPGVSFS